MRHGNFDFRHQRTQLCRDLVQVRDTRTNVKCLPATEMFAHYGFADHYIVERHHERSDGKPVDRRRTDQAHFLHAAQGHLECAGYRCRGQGKNVNVGLQVFQALFMRNAEMLFFVDDQQFQLVERNRLAEQRMCADDNIHFTVREAFADLVGIFTGDQA